MASALMAKGMQVSKSFHRLRPRKDLQPHVRGVQYGRGTQLQFPRENLPTKPLEDEDDDEDENDVPHEWRPTVCREDFTC